MTHGFRKHFAEGITLTGRFALLPCGNREGLRRLVKKKGTVHILSRYYSCEFAAQESFGERLATYAIACNVSN